MKESAKALQDLAILIDKIEAFGNVKIIITIKEPKPSKATKDE